MSDRVELTKDERVSIGTAMRGWDTRTEGVIAAVESIVAARVAALTADRTHLAEKVGRLLEVSQELCAERDAARAELAAANTRCAELEAEREQLLRAGRQFELADTADECRCGHGRTAHICTFTATRCFGCGCTEYRAALTPEGTE